MLFLLHVSGPLLEKLWLSFLFSSVRQVILGAPYLPKLKSPSVFLFPGCMSHLAIFFYPETKGLDKGMYEGVVFTESLVSSEKERKGEIQREGE